MLVENQQYIHYQKGSLVFYALRDYFGEEAVNAALRELLRDFAFKGPPFPTSRELVERLRAHAPERYAYMIEDMFETITLYDNRVIDGSFRALEDGRFEVNFEVNARKLRADELGNEEEIEMDDWIEVGVFAAAGPGEGDLGEALYLEKVQLKKGPTKIQAIVDGRPAQVGVDPYNKLIDRRIKDNLKAPRLEG